MSIKIVSRAKKGHVYKVVIDLPRGGQRTKSFDRKRDAELWQAEQKVRQSKPDPFSVRETTFEEFFVTWLKNREGLIELSSMRRYQSYHRVILTHFCKYRLAEIRPSQIENWRNRLLTVDGYSQKSVRDVVGLLKKIFNDAVSLEYLEVNPARFMSMPRMQERDFSFWSESEANTFLQYISRHEPNFYPIYVMALNTGMRLGELRALQWDCIDLARKVITVKRTFCSVRNVPKETTKSKCIRRIPINQKLLSELEMLRSQRSGEFVLPYLDYVKMYRYTRKFAKRAGVKLLRCHDLRHTFASLFMMGGGKFTR
jgi:integrase